MSETSSSNPSGAPKKEVLTYKGVPVVNLKEAPQGKMSIYDVLPDELIKKLNLKAPEDAPDIANP